jgi:serine/threonine-protein kinase
MGEVYRADDLKLGQPVALKFLPPGFNADPDRLARFLNEVRTARQVSHTNVCRIYDAGETDGQHFLSMEYVDGEDLASLLRRIGHLPKDKAIQIARQLCAGLSAAHDIGVLHRDLKPANIMIDGRGRARITDFGLAAFAGDIEGDEIRSGTPAYMAPEQLAGREVTVRSDIYALGLVLYELFTGKPAFKAASEITPSAPSSLVEGFDPMVERVILRCLDADPARRPASALTVAAALPGGDPLAAALAAGETPSPEMVAEAGDTGAASPVFAWGALGAFAGIVAVLFALAPRTALVAMVPLDKPPEVLEERAREILALAGHVGKPADSISAFDANTPYLDSMLHREGAGSAHWDALRSTPPGGLLFWYRESPRAVAPINGANIGLWMSDPPFTVPGMARVSVDPDGRLMSLLVVPGERTEPGPNPAAPEWAPPVFADRRAAWTGTWLEKPDLPLRIEAAAAGSRPVSLQIVLPWTRPAEEPAAPKGFWSETAQLANGLWFVVVVTVAGVVALRNVRRGRGDRRGALRLALYLGAMRMMWFIGAHHVASPDELTTFVAHLSFAMQRVGLAYVFYLAIEPYARRLWPRMLVSWVRVLEGRFRDPLVGRDLLIGCVAGSAVALFGNLSSLIPEMFGASPALPSWGEWSSEPLRGTVYAFVSVLGIHTQHLFEIIYPLTSVLMFRLLLRRNDLAVVGVSLVAFVLFFPESGSIPGYVVGLSAALVISWLVLFRSGLLAFATMFVVNSMLSELPLTLHPPGWYVGVMLLLLAFILAPALWGFWTSQGGRSLFRDEILGGAAER